MNRLKSFVCLTFVMIFTLTACAPAAPQATATSTVDMAATQAAQSAATAQAEQNAKATADKATADAKSAADAKSTSDAKATADQLNTKNTQVAEQATTTADALAKQNAKSTADAQATVDAKNAQATQTAEAISALVKKDLDLLGVDASQGKLGWLQTDPITVKLDTAWEYNTLPAAEGVSASDFVIKTDLTWNTSGILICGIVFRSDRNLLTGNQYLLEFLQFSGLPGWDILFLKDEKIASNITGKARFADALKLNNDDTNTILLWVEGNKFTLFINDKRIGSFYDYSNLSMQGLFGFYGNQESGSSTCEFANSWVWVLK